MSNSNLPGIPEWVKSNSDFDLSQWIQRTVWNAQDQTSRYLIHVTSGGYEKRDDVTRDADIWTIFIATPCDPHTLKPYEYSKIIEVKPWIYQCIQNTDDVWFRVFEILWSLQNTQISEMIEGEEIERKFSDISPWQVVEIQTWPVTAFSDTLLSWDQRSGDESYNPNVAKDTSRITGIKILSQPTTV